MAPKLLMARTLTYVYVLAANSTLEGVECHHFHVRSTSHWLLFLLLLLSLQFGGAGRALSEVAIPYREFAIPRLWELQVLARVV